MVENNLGEYNKKINGVHYFRKTKEKIWENKDNGLQTTMAALRALKDQITIIFEIL